MPAGVNAFPDKETALSHWSDLNDPNHDVYLQFELSDDDEILAAYVGKSNIILRGGGATYNDQTGKYNDDSIYYDSNVSMLDTHFNNCGENPSNHGYYCETNSLAFGAMRNGSVSISAAAWGCYVDPDGKALCWSDNE